MAVAFANPAVQVPLLSQLRLNAGWAVHGVWGTGANVVPENRLGWRFLLSL